MTSPTDAPPLEDLLEFLKRNRGFDFTGYKRSTLERRIAKRTAEVGIESHAEYVEFLELHPDEFGGALQHDPHQRHRVLPRPRRLGAPAHRGAARAARAAPCRGADPRLVGGLRLGRGGLLGRHDPV